MFQPLMIPMAPSPAEKLNLKGKLWPPKTELVGLEFDLVAVEDCRLYSQYTIGLHAWFLQQIQDFDPELSAHLHDSEQEKAFNLSGLSGQFTPHSRSLQLQANRTYQWHLNVFSQPAVKGLGRWLKRLPDTLTLRKAPLQIQQVRLALAPTTYKQLAQVDTGRNLSLSFVSPTSFRRKGHHLPLPWPTNVFHSYLRRWNSLAGEAVDPTEFLQWIDEGVIIQRHHLQTQKIAAGKRGSVTGFTGAVTYGLSAKAAQHEAFQQLFFTLGHFAPYCGTGHKTPFGLGQTRLGWRQAAPAAAAAPAQDTLAARIEELTELFFSQKKRTGGDRARHSAETWATVLARRERGDSLQAIAADLEIPYTTAKTYSKLARRALRELGGG